MIVPADEGNGSWWLRKVVPLIGGAIFLVMFGVRYAWLSSEDYFLRDDGVITLSHAVNLVDYGFIGVNPSGERVEGFSAPVQFWIYALFYSVGLSDLSVYNVLQTAVCTLLVGYLFTKILDEEPVLALLSSGAAALLLSGLTSFVQWHASGMENAITHVLFISTVFVLYRFAAVHRVSSFLVLVPFLASISRIDGIVHVLPLLVVFVIYWSYVERNLQAVRFLGLFSLLWAGFNLWRLHYFGSLSPNTAIAQGIEVRENIKALISLDPDALLTGARLGHQIFAVHGGYFLVLLIPVLWRVRLSSPRTLLCVLSVMIIASGWFNPFVFGVTRLDVTRSTTQVALFVCLAIAVAFQAVLRDKRRMLFLILAPLAFVIWKATYTPPYYLCCTTVGMDRVRLEFEEVARSEEIPRPTVSNPDLGIVSWHKQFNIVDLGRLGSILMAKIKNGPLLSDYFFEYAAPDMIESHNWWSCLHLDTVFLDPRFAERYRPVRQESLKIASCGDRLVPDGLWVRRDVMKGASSRERRFMDRMSDKEWTPGLVAGELAECEKVATRSSDCAYVSRTLYRHLPEIRAAGGFDEIVDVFSQSRSVEWDRFLLLGSRDPTLSQPFLEKLSGLPAGHSLSGSQGSSHVGRGAGRVGSF